MSNLNLENNLIENVTFFYPKIKQAVFKYQSQTEKEYTVDVLVDKATAKSWSKVFGKQKPKELDAEEFGDKYGKEFVQDGVDDYFVIKLKKGATYLDKETKEIKDLPDAYRPRAFIEDENGDLGDITYTTLIGNGSKGVVQFEVNENSYGTFGKLLAIKVEELVVVEQSDSSGKFNVLGKVKSLAENPNKGFASNGGTVDTTNKHEVDLNTDKQDLEDW